MILGGRQLKERTAILTKLQQFLQIWDYAVAQGRWLCRTARQELMIGDSLDEVARDRSTHGGLRLRHAVDAVDDEEIFVSPSWDLHHKTFILVSKAIVRNSRPISR